MEVIKRNGDIVEFDKDKIYNAIFKAMKYGSGIIRPAIALSISDDIEKSLLASGKQKITILEIEAMVFNMLIAKKQKLTAKAYESYRAVQEFKREHTELDNRIEGIVDGSNTAIINENSNKNSHIASTQRDLIAGEYSKDYSRRTLLPINILHAHDEGIIHMHDLDYFIQKIINCCLVNLDDMLQNGTVINRKMIDKPNSLRTACTVATQIVQQIANGQYGGQTISLAHLAPFVRVSHEKWLKKVRYDLDNIGFRSCCASDEMYDEFIKDIASRRLDEEIKDGIQTIQYQINTFSTSNGQAPFLSIFMYINEMPGYEKETAMLINEMLKQRIIGMKNEVGVYITPAFPKLLYVTDENNIYPESEYYYLTELAAECVSKRMLPDFISAKIMKEQFDGEVFGPMGCRAYLAPYKDPITNKYKWYGRFNQGTVCLNLVDAGLSAEKDIDMFWSIINERLDLCYQALMIRHERLKNTSINSTPIHWKYGGISRIEDSNFNDLLYNGYSTISLGYAGVYECVYALIGESHTSKNGEKLALEIVSHLRTKCEQWKEKTNIGFALYGTPLESTTDKFAKCLKKRFGIVPNVTDHDYITNSYHVNVKEVIDAEVKLKFESQFHSISSGGCISYVETCNLSSNIPAIIQQIQFMYENIRYAELNGKFDFCQVCKFEGEILLDESKEWYCPNCGNRDHTKMNVARRTCGYIGDNFWNEGRTEEIGDRYVHIDNQDMNLD